MRNSLPGTPFSVRDQARQPTQWKSWGMSGGLEFGVFRWGYASAGRGTLSIVPRLFALFHRITRALPGGGQGIGAKHPQLVPQPGQLGHVPPHRPLRRGARLIWWDKRLLVWAKTIPAGDYLAPFTLLWRILKSHRVTFLRLAPARLGRLLAPACAGRRDVPAIRYATLRA